MKAPRVVLLGTFAVWVGAASAEEASSKVNSSTTMVQPELNACAEAGYASVDASLNRVYKDLMARVPNADSKEKLRREERAWIASRDKQCND